MLRTYFFIEIFSVYNLYICYMEIKKYTDSDKTLVLDLLSTNIPDYFAKSEVDDLIYYLDNFADNYFIVKQGEEVLGSGGFNLTEDGRIARLSWDIVNPAFQRKGIGTYITTYRLQQILKIPTVEIVSVRTSQLVYRFYEKFGLILQEIIPDYWAKGFDMYRLECKTRNLIL